MPPYDYISNTGRVCQELNIMLYIVSGEGGGVGVVTGPSHEFIHYIVLER